MASFIAAVVFRPRKAVALILEDDVRDGARVGAHGRDDLIRFGDLDARIVRALRDEERCRNTIGHEERRLRGKECFVFAHAPRELAAYGRPIRRDGFQEGVEVRRADDVDAADERIGCER
jgi:hypothetical protein